MSDKTKHNDSWDWEYIKVITVLGTIVAGLFALSEVVNSNENKQHDFRGPGNNDKPWFK
ncbi:hypothetical protein [Desulfonatronovibrio magnus]|uniref:hypothetical protein n=1 Tax=Desulfonatronovibrio magnus TaxID=698827 RepID=UPI0012FA6129|nr:hypothetical protein [Desulfonatronovibrio magnus]